MKIAVLVPSPNPACGIGGYAAALASQLQQLGHEVTVTPASGSRRPVTGSTGPRGVDLCIINWSISSKDYARRPLMAQRIRRSGAAVVVVVHEVHTTAPQTAKRNAISFGQRVVATVWLSRHEHLIAPSEDLRQLLFGRRLRDRVEVSPFGPTVNPSPVSGVNRQSDLVAVAPHPANEWTASVIRGIEKAGMSVRVIGQNRGAETESAFRDSGFQAISSSGYLEPAAYAKELASAMCFISWRQGATVRHTTVINALGLGVPVISVGDSDRTGWGVKELHAGWRPGHLGSAVDSKEVASMVIDAHLGRVDVSDALSCWQRWTTHTSSILRVAR